METRKLYYEDCHLRRFQALVVGCQQTEKGWEVILDQTAFYPEGGGQACDLGRLDHVRVLDVRERGGEIVHLCDGPLTPWAAVTGALDWERRFDQMQQHTGEHMVSGIIHRKFGYHNVGFHVGADVVTIDFDGPVSLRELALIEAEANQKVWENLPVSWGYPAREELEAIAYRSKRELPWPVRIVQVPGVDACACCGVHTSFTGEVGLIKLFSCVKFHNGVRIEMACGKRALDLLSGVYEQNRQVSQAFSAKIMETGEAARKMNEALAEEKFRSAGLEKQVFAAVARGYAGAGDVVHFADNLAMSAIRSLAEEIAAVCGGTAAVFSGGDEEGYGVCIFSAAADTRILGKALCDRLNGRGGGKPGAFQGSIKSTRREIEAFFVNSGNFVQ